MTRLMGMAAVLLQVMVIAGCSSNAPVSAPEQVLAFAAEEYTIGVGDQLTVNVWRNENLSVQVPVRPDGKISVPLIGDVMAADKTAEGLAADITKRLEEYIRNPQVTVIVSNPESSDFQQRVRVTGAVANPTSVPYRKGMTVLDLVLMAGGPNEFASHNRSKLYRRVAGEVKVYPIYLGDILQKGELDTNYPLLPSDIVTVPERSF